MANPNLVPPPTFPFGMNTPGLASMAITNPLALPQATTKNLFTITGGPIRVLKLFGVVTTVIGAVANATKLEYVDAVTSTVTALDLTADVNALAAGALFVLVTSTGTAASMLTAGIGPVASATLMFQTILLPGVIRVNCAGSDGGTGRIQWYLQYEPLSVGALNAGGVQITMPAS